MPDRDRRPATNDHIVLLLEEMRSALDESKKRAEQIARDVSRLIKYRAT